MQTNRHSTKCNFMLTTQFQEGKHTKINSYPLTHKHSMPSIFFSKSLCPLFAAADFLYLLSWYHGDNTTIAQSDIHDAPLHSSIYAKNLNFLFAPFKYASEFRCFNEMWTIFHLYLEKAFQHTFLKCIFHQILFEDFLLSLKPFPKCT